MKVLLIDDHPLILSALQSVILGLGGDVSLWLDDQPIGQGRLSRTVPWVMSYVEGMNVGLDTGTPVSEDYAVPFAFAGVLHSVKVAML